MYLEVLCCTTVVCTTCYAQKRGFCSPHLPSRPKVITTTPHWQTRKERRWKGGREAPFSLTQCSANREKGREKEGKEESQLHYTESFARMLEKAKQNEVVARAVRRRGGEANSYFEVSPVVVPAWYLAKEVFRTLTEFAAKSVLILAEFLITLCRKQKLQVLMCMKVWKVCAKSLFFKEIYSTSGRNLVKRAHRKGNYRANC